MLSWSGEPWRSVQLAADTGFHFIVVDFEHGGAACADVEVAAALARALGIKLLVRIRECSDISTALDCGAHGVLIPHVETAEQAKNYSAFAKYADEGHRSLSSTRLWNFGEKGDWIETVKLANKNSIVIVIVESLGAISQISQIASVPQVDGIAIGSMDLSAELGSPGATESMTILDAMRQAADACHASGKIFAAFWKPSAAPHIFSLSPDMIIAGSDLTFYYKGAREEISQIKKMISL